MESTSDWNLTKCPTCGREGLVDGERELSRMFDGRTFTMKVPARVCPHCGESLVHGDDMARFEAAIDRALLESGARDGATVKWLRKSAGLRAADLAELLGVAIETVSRWENDRTTIDRAALHTLGRLAIEANEGKTDTADTLRAMASPPSRHSPLVRFLEARRR